MPGHPPTFRGSHVVELGMSVRRPAGVGKLGREIAGWMSRSAQMIELGSGNSTIGRGLGPRFFFGEFAEVVVAETRLRRLFGIMEMQAILRMNGARSLRRRNDSERGKA